MITLTISVMEDKSRWSKLFPFNEKRRVNLRKEMNRKLIEQFFQLTMKKNQVGEYFTFGEEHKPIWIQLERDRFVFRIFHNDSAPLSVALDMYDWVQRFIQESFTGKRMYVRFGADCKITIERGRVTSVVYSEHELYKGKFDLLRDIDMMVLHY